MLKLFTIMLFVISSSAYSGDSQDGLPFGSGLEAALNAGSSASRHDGVQGAGGVNSDTKIEVVGIDGIANLLQYVIALQCFLVGQNMWRLVVLAKSQRNIL